jgi:hypothetical protein
MTLALSRLIGTGQTKARWLEADLENLEIGGDAGGTIAAARAAA